MFLKNVCTPIWSFKNFPEGIANSRATNWTGKPKSAELSGNSAALEKSCEFGGSDGKNPGRVWEFWSCGIMLQELQHSFSFKEKFLL